MYRCFLRLTAVAAGTCMATSALAQKSEEELAMQLANPVTALISVPFQFNCDENIGPLDEGTRSYLNIQPVNPVSLNADWNLISRTIVPLIDHDDIVPGAGGQSGLGDITQSAFFSPVEPADGGWIRGIGPALLLPTATAPPLGADKWAIGPAAVALRQQGPWTCGGLVNHLASVAGDGDQLVSVGGGVRYYVESTDAGAEGWSLRRES